MTGRLLIVTFNILPSSSLSSTIDDFCNDDEIGHYISPIMIKLPIKVNCLDEFSTQIICAHLFFSLQGKVGGERCMCQSFR